MQSQEYKPSICRYLYLNSYALLLLLVGGGILLLPGWLIHWSVVIAQVVVALPFLKNGIRILNAWESKMREYNILMQRNAKNFTPSSFAKYMEAPCGRLLVRVVLKDLGCSKRYKELKVYKKSIWHFLSTDMCSKKSVGASIRFFDGSQTSADGSNLTPPTSSDDQ